MYFIRDHHTPELMNHLEKTSMNIDLISNIAIDAILYDLS